jgi:hypothetical protein
MPGLLVDASHVRTSLVDVAECQDITVVDAKAVVMALPGPAEGGAPVAAEEVATAEEVMPSSSSLLSRTATS